jgi:hypothetical protein
MNMVILVKQGADASHERTLFGSSHTLDRKAKVRASGSLAGVRETDGKHA